jgi:hypothetical protein
MALITVHDLQPAGQGFFADSESFMDELGGADLEISAIVGGLVVRWDISSCCCLRPPELA